jgi:[acyl-carrier-protein] S-malonyltransferase
MTEPGFPALAGWAGKERARTIQRYGRRATPPGPIGRYPVKCSDFNSFLASRGLTCAGKRLCLVAKQPIQGNAGMTRAFVFPGQGSQAVGMGRDLAEAFAVARQVFEEVDEALKQKLSALMRDGPEDQLTLTENAQPALMAVSLAVMRTLEREFGVGVDKAAFVAGHSLGEYSALAAAGAISVAETARLLKRRGQAMQRAVPVGRGAMASLIGPKTDIALAEEAAKAGSEVGVCVVANDNNAGNVVISGDKAAVDRAIEKAKELGARAIPLNVSAPFHCPLMQPAADEMAEALAGASIVAPRAPIVANVTARPTNDPETIRRLLVEQVTGRVRWRESVTWMAGEGGVTRFAEAGAGKVLAGMVKRIAPDAEAVSLNGPADLEAFAKSL